MTESTTRRRAMMVGLLIGVPAILLGGLPAAAWRVADQRLSTGGSAWSNAAHGPRVALGTSVRISGSNRRLLKPGVSSRINLRFSNPSHTAVTLRHVRITITGIAAPEADSEHPCTRADFRILPMRDGTLVLPGDASTDLLRLAVPSWRWPHLKMLNRSVNQDGCKGASLTLGYLGYRVWSA